jgi:hypothetical protein
VTRRAWWLWTVAAGLAWWPAGVAQAHAPAVLSPSTPYLVKDATVSRALYGTFQGADDVFVVRLRPDTRLALPFELLVPRRDGLADHRPAYAVIAPGMPALDPADVARLPRALPAGAGGFVDWNQAPEREVIFESFLRRVYWSSGPVALLVPAGEVEVWIWSPEGSRGDFVLGFGVEEGGIDYWDVVRHWRVYAY